MGRSLSRRPSRSRTRSDPEEPDDPALRSSFDPREEGLATPVRDQGATELCGPFASMASLETSLVYDGAASDELIEAGLSPFHAVYFATMGDEEREAGGLNAFMPDNPYGGGISPFTIANSLAAGKGAVIAREGRRMRPTSRWTRRCASQATCA